MTGGSCGDINDGRDLEPNMGEDVDDEVQEARLLRIIELVELNQAEMFP